MVSAFHCSGCRPQHSLTLIIQILTDHFASKLLNNFYPTLLPLLLHTCDALQVMSRPVKVCVVGAGAVGLCAARHFCRLPQFFTVSIIEPSARVGGVWTNPDKNADCHQYG